MQEESPHLHCHLVMQEIKKLSLGFLLVSHPSGLAAGGKEVFKSLNTPGQPNHRFYIRTFISQRENRVSDSQIIVGKISIFFLYKHRFSYYLSYTI